MRGGDEVIADGGDVIDGDELRGMSRSRGESCDASFESGHSFFKDVSRRVHQAGVDVTELLEGKQLGTVGGVFELIGRRLIDRHGT